MGLPRLPHQGYTFQLPGMERHGGHSESGHRVAAAKQIGSMFRTRIRCGGEGVRYELSGNSSRRTSDMRGTLGTAITPDAHMYQSPLVAAPRLRAADVGTHLEP